MSENIQSIANGSFVLGNTNELTFSAGPGIKIDQPSEGTVRIANDETVLWSGSNSTATMLLNDNVNNYESVRFYYGAATTDSNRQIVESTYSTDSSACKLIFYTTDEDPNFKIRTTTVSLSGTSAIPRTGSICRLTIGMPGGNIAGSVATGQGPLITKIVGINRKEV